MNGTFARFRISEDYRYGDGRHSDLPWGYWLISTSDSPGQPPLVDEEGREWRSVREAFWESRLGLPNERSHHTDQILEFMASYLAIVDRRFVDKEERVSDIFQGDHNLDTFFSYFLTAAGLLSTRHGTLTPEGRAVLQMLIATRSEDHASEQVGLDWIVANRTVAGRNEKQSAAEAVSRGEQVAARMLHRFSTDTIDGQPSVKLIGLHITQEIPVRSTLWSMSWPANDQYARDRFYLWLLERIDRWDAWSAMVIEDGVRALTEHLMKLSFCDRFAGP